MFPEDKSIQNSFIHMSYIFFIDLLMNKMILIKLTFLSLRRWLFKYLKVDSIHFSSRSISAVIYLKVVGAQNHPIILYYQKFGSKESYLFFATEHSVVKNVKKCFLYFNGFLARFKLFWPSFNLKLGQNRCKPC